MTTRAHPVLVEIARAAARRDQAAVEVDEATRHLHSLIAGVDGEVSAQDMAVAAGMGVQGVRNVRCRYLARQAAKAGG